MLGNFSEDSDLCRIFSRSGSKPGIRCQTIENLISCRVKSCKFQRVSLMTDLVPSLYFPRGTDFRSSVLRVPRDCLTNSMPSLYWSFLLGTSTGKRVNSGLSTLSSLQRSTFVTNPVSLSHNKDP